MKLIVGLGNPGRKYQGTRHNIGFEIVREVSRLVGNRGEETNFRRRFESELCTTRLGDITVVLQMPQTYMNLSGKAVLQASDFYKVPSEHTLVICDDLHLVLAQLRFRPTGSAGGQKGLDDIIRQLGTNEIPRMRFGIGAPPQGWDASDFVLGCFTKDEEQIVSGSIPRAAEAVCEWVQFGIDLCMSRYNAKQTN